MRESKLQVSVTPDEKSRVEFLWRMHSSERSVSRLLHSVVVKWLEAEEKRLGIVRARTGQP